MTDQPASLAEALALLQTQLPDIPKASKAQYGAYANLTDVSKKLLPVMGKLGLSFVCVPTLGGPINEDGGRFTLEYTLRHVSGDGITGFYPLPTSGSPQALGSAITYGRRYCLCAVTGAVAEEDDDGAAASQPPTTRRRESPPRRPKDELPRNADGSVSRSRTTDAELAATGQMTDAQIREHGRLEREVKGTGPQGTERLTATPADDPFYQPALPTPRAAGNIAGVIHREFARLGFTDDQRPARLKVMSTITGRDITSTNDLSAAEALEVKRLIQSCKDQGVLAEKLIQHNRHQRFVEKISGVDG